MRQSSATKNVKRSKQNRVISEIKQHSHSKANASKKVLYTKQLSCKISQVKSIHILELQRTSSKPTLINIISSFRLEHRMSTKTLSEHIWKLEKGEIDHTVKWEILEKALLDSTSTGRYNLSIPERIICTKGRHSTNDVSCSEHAPTEENVSCRMRNCRMRTQMERE